MKKEQQDIIDEIYKDFHNTLNPLIQTYEVFAENFPIEILNEIRSVTTHLSRCYVDGVSDSYIDKNIEKAQSHMKRAILDGFKYNCVAYQGQIEKFRNSHDRVLALIDNGKFLNDFFIKETEAQDAFLKAKKSEAEGDDSAVYFKLYEDAYNKYFELHELVKAKKVDCEKVKSLIDSEYKKKYTISLIFNIAMAIIAVASLIFGILGWLK